MDNRSRDAVRRIRPLPVAFGLVVVMALALIAACASSPSDPEATPKAAAGSALPASEAGTKPDIEMLSVPKQAGLQHLEYRYGPITIEPGQNNIDFSGRDVPKPQVDGSIVAISPDLVRMDGDVPRVDILHLHHGVWSAKSKVAGGRDPVFGRELFFAAGEEKTKMILPAGYGYPYHASDNWNINYMLHNLLTTPDQVWITYDIDFIPSSSPAARNIKPARPIWLDVQKGSLYPVFDVLKGSGEDGTFTYPDQADKPYGSGAKLNEWKADRDGVLIAAGGHLHPGGLSVDLFVRRDGAEPTGAAAPAVESDTAQIFSSKAIYYEPAGAVSWDVSMTVTPPDWRVAVKKGDVITISATYDTKRASWYESMGISVMWITDDAEGEDPFATRVDDVKPVLTHGHLAENRNHGGVETDSFVDMSLRPTGPATDKVTIADFTFAPGDMSGIYDDVPAVKAGARLTFYNTDAPRANGIWHTITACKAPCNRTTGVAYPLADADVQFDSGELGIAGPPTAGRISWTVPDDLPAGTYTYFCRIHPSMRGAFRITD